MLETLTLFEHQCTTDFNWTNAEMTKLSHLNGAVSAPVLNAVVKNGKRELQASEQVGVVRFGNRSVNILPKIYRTNGFSDQETTVREATENLRCLLAYAGNLKISESEIASLQTNKLDWFEILTKLFASHLLAEWRRGAMQGYQSVADELPVLKGKWRFNEQMRRPAVKHIFSVAFDEFTADNRLNRVFRFVVEKLWRITGNASNKKLLGDLRSVLDEVTLLPNVSVADADKSILNRTNSRFAPLLNLARLFLNGGALQLAGGDTESFAFVFDMNQLFELFLCEFIKRHREELLPDELKDCDLLAQTKGATRFLALHEAKAVFRLKPDLSFRRADKTFPLIIDAKYKRLKEQDRWRGVLPADFYQMHAYAHRYECPRVLLIYPQTAEMQNSLRAVFRLQNSNVIIKAATINLRLRLSQKSERKKLITELRNIFHEATSEETRN